MSSNVELFQYYDASFEAFRNCIDQIAMGRNNTSVIEKSKNLEATLHLMLEAKAMDPDWDALPVELQDQYHRLFAHYGEVGYVRYQNNLGMARCIETFKGKIVVGQKATRRAFSEIYVRPDYPEVNTVLADFAQNLSDAGIETERVFAHEDIQPQDFQLPRDRFGINQPYVKILPTGIIGELLPDRLTIAYSKTANRIAITR
ncbi:MAG: hypothetical protein HY817_00325 [Candidatus Abawacabacteria bacterium]|nr:hypothetical protein [Candidatus Abawacabacteria bacterium]